MGETIRLPFGAKGLFFRGDLFVSFREWIFLIFSDNISYIYIYIIFIFRISDQVVVSKICFNPSLGR